MMLHFKNIIPLLGIAFTLLFFSACEDPFPEYTEFDEGIYYKIHYLGDGDDTPVKGNHIRARMVYKTLEDTVIFDTKSNYFDGVRMFSVDKHKSKLTDAICMLHEGDSATFILKDNVIQVDSFKMTLAKSVEYIKVVVKIESILTPKEYQAEAQKIAWLRDQEMNEQVDLISYLAKNEIDRAHYYEGIYYQEIEKGKGRSPKSGDIVSVQYKAFFVDGTIFDDTYKNAEPLTFHLGKPGQVIKGFSTGVRLMREKGKARFIIPSQSGYGKKGSSTGIVKPYTSLIYEVELLSTQPDIILKKDS